MIATTVGLSLLTAQETKQAPPPGQTYRAKEILGSKVTLGADASVGIVDDIVLDENGNVDYLIVKNEANKLVTVPWDATEFDAKKRMSVLHIAPEKFQQVPTYTVEQYPAFATPTYRSEVYRYYGLTPAQERRMIRRGVLPR